MVIAEPMHTSNVPSRASGSCIQSLLVKRLRHDVSMLVCCLSQKSFAQSPLPFSASSLTAKTPQTQMGPLAHSKHVHSPPAHSKHVLSPPAHSKHVLGQLRRQLAYQLHAQPPRGSQLPESLSSSFCSRAVCQLCHSAVAACPVMIKWSR